MPHYTILRGALASLCAGVIGAAFACGQTGPHHVGPPNEQPDADGGGGHDAAGTDAGDDADDDTGPDGLDVLVHPGWIDPADEPVGPGGQVVLRATFAGRVDWPGDPGAELRVSVGPGEPVEVAADGSFSGRANTQATALIVVTRGETPVLVERFPKHPLLADVEPNPGPRSTALAMLSLLAHPFVTDPVFVAALDASMGELEEIDALADALADAIRRTPDTAPFSDAAVVAALRLALRAWADRLVSAADEPKALDGDVCSAAVCDVDRRDADCLFVDSLLRERDRRLELDLQNDARRWVLVYLDGPSSTHPLAPSATNVDSRLVAMVGPMRLHLVSPGDIVREVVLAAIREAIRGGLLRALGDATV